MGAPMGVPPNAMARRIASTRPRMAGFGRQLHRAIRGGGDLGVVGNAQARKIIDPRSASGLFEALPSHFGRGGDWHTCCKVPTSFVTVVQQATRALRRPCFNFQERLFAAPIGNGAGPCHIEATTQRS